MTARQISDTLADIYGFEASEGFISDVTDKIMPQIEDWQNRPLSEVYPEEHLQHKCDREPECRIPKTKPPTQRVSQ